MGQSAALNLKQGIAVRKLPCNHWGVQGTPADAAHLACSGLLDPMPDILVSGINHGSNAGDAIYSGTVMACTAGVWCSLPPVAVSMVDDGHRRFDTAAKCAVDWIKRMKARKDRFGSVAFPQDIRVQHQCPRHLLLADQGVEDDHHRSPSMLAALQEDRRGRGSFRSVDARRAGR